MDPLQTDPAAAADKGDDFSSDAFLSYASADAAVAERVCSHLEGAEIVAEPNSGDVVAVVQDMAGATDLARLGRAPLARERGRVGDHARKARRDVVIPRQVAARHEPHAE